MNDNQPRQASSFTSLADRRAFLASAPDTHANYRGENWPVGAWCKRTKDSETFKALRDWQHFNDMPRLVANDNDPRWPDNRKFVEDLDRRMETHTAEQLIYAFENGNLRIHNGKITKLFSGYRVQGVDEEFHEPRAAKDPKVDAMHWHAEPPDAEEETIRAIDTARLRSRLGATTCAILDTASSGGTLREIGEGYGFAGKYAERIGRKRLAHAVASLRQAA